ncbi:hypothetical protein M406DRAFT_334518 [Cryphonectria parasitica EP155]|uniref:Glucose-methanol-choline oxidoreductase N-terminal domain-containing protein n=1 Tax=Cryphonectria parasitica (strain ATCC 38755 / EP155) TaxID=660469 RepID=A0A9P5CKE8_CRYP1|nr:uncharacterized protein M406DRAFT_334518 [Cryphonectria parasitica EP155]KAF3760896.1 hypothetical protein M406DRAFT_334518 [Cryphonectria parasitica EP155]
MHFDEGSIKEKKSSLRSKTDATKDIEDVSGGGPAGIVAATRLAQSSSKSVLLLSRGQGPTVQTGAVGTVGWNESLTPIDVPGLSTAVADYNVGDETLFNAYLCADTPDVYASCVFGGGASINYMVFPHPPEHDFDDKWPTGWKWDDMAEAADRVWSLNPGTSLPSKDGKRYDQGMYETVSKFLDSQGWSSVNSSAEPNKKTKAYSYPNWDIGNQERVGPLRTYLPLAEELDNFSYQLNSTVRRVIRDGSQATGVEFETESGAIQTIGLNEGGKVILAAGPWGTPRILFNSGIGPIDQIETVANGTTGVVLPPKNDWINLPVGQAIKDHPIFTFYVQTPDNWTAFNVTTVVDGTDTADIDLYETAGSGVLAQGYHRMVFWTSNVASDNITRYYQGSVSPQGPGLFLIKGYLTHGATSSGTMGISANGDVTYTQKPYLRDDGDKEGATMFIEEMLESMSSYEGWEMAEGYTNVSYILSSYSQGDHYLGTANIGTDARTSVVSAEDVKVWGMDNLHIVDSSIHADLPTGNTQAITMVVAEKAVEKIIGAADSPSAPQLKRRNL